MYTYMCGYVLIYKYVHANVYTCMHVCKSEKSSDPRSPGIHSVHAGQGAGEEEVSEMSQRCCPGDNENGMCVRYACVVMLVWGSERGAVCV